MLILHLHGAFVHRCDISFGDFVLDAISKLTYFDSQYNFEIKWSIYIYNIKFLIQ